MKCVHYNTDCLLEICTRSFQVLVKDVVTRSMRIFFVLEKIQKFEYSKC